MKPSPTNYIKYFPQPLILNIMKMTLGSVIETVIEKNFGILNQSLKTLGSVIIIDIFFTLRVIIIENIPTGYYGRMIVSLLGIQEVPDAVFVSDWL
jgi:hypothetical protein